MILARSKRLAAFETLAGLSGALFATRGLSALFYETPPTDHIDPVQALRAE
jgi:hypothetical protein